MKRALVAAGLALAACNEIAMVGGPVTDPEHSWDGRFVREGRDQYAAFANTGLSVIATDRPIEASRDLDANDGIDGVGALQCARQDPTGHNDRWTSED
jgi:hypothetical protein